MTSRKLAHSHISSVLLRVISSVLAFCPSVTLKKMSYMKGLHHYEQFKTIPDCRNYVVQKVSRYKNYQTEPFSRRGVAKKLTLFAKMSVRYAKIFTFLMKSRAWFEIPSVW